jgi:hypothetical protein
MRRIVFVLAFALQGAILAYSGLNPATWQYWVVSALTAVASIALAWDGV